MTTCFWNGGQIANVICVGFFSVVLQLHKCHWIFLLMALASDVWAGLSFSLISLVKETLILHHKHGFCVNGCPAADSDRLASKVV